VGKLLFDLVSIDIDGTLTRESGWRFLADRLGRLKEFGDQNATYTSGKESEDDHLRALLSLASGLPLARVEAWIEATPKLSGIAEAVGAIRDLGAIPVLLSHNPGYVSEWYARTFGFADWDGTSQRPDPEVWDGIVRPPGRIRADKRGGLKRLLARHRTVPGRVAHVGDGLADAAIFPLVGFGVAVNTTLPAVASCADVSLDISDLRGILPPLRSAVPRSVPETFL
jgi:phosphoserine phosphatase